jgi:hypothetical protein
MATAQPPPDLKIPHGDTAVEVSIIDTTASVDGIPTALFMQPPVLGYEKVNAPCYGFLVKHKNPAKENKYDTLIFDLGVIKNWDTDAPPVHVKMIKDGGIDVKVENDAAQILKENGEKLEDVGAIVWSHHL